MLRRHRRRTALVEERFGSKLETTVLRRGVVGDHRDRQRSAGLAPVHVVVRLRWRAGVVEDDDPHGGGSGRVVRVADHVGELVVGAGRRAGREVDDTGDVGIEPDLVALCGPGQTGEGIDERDRVAIGVDAEQRHRYTNLRTANRA